MANIPPDLNPYNAPISSTIENAPGGAEAIRNQYLSHEASVKSIGLLYMLGGILGILVRYDVWGDAASEKHVAV